MTHPKKELTVACNYLLRLMKAHVELTPEQILKFKRAFHDTLAKRFVGHWLQSWSHLTDDDLDREVLQFSGKTWPAWKIIETIIQHDVYHAGQMVVIRFATLESTVPPPSVAEDIRKYCAELPSW